MSTKDTEVLKPKKKHKRTNRKRTLNSYMTPSLGKVSRDIEANHKGVDSL